MNARDLDLERRATRHAALADVLRLRIVDALAVSDLTVGELRRVGDVPANLLSHHLRVLGAAGLIVQRVSDADRRQRYVHLRSPGDSGSASVPLTPPRVLFVCTGNSARSPLGAAAWAHQSTIPVDSAGTHPAASMAPGAVRAARAAGLTLAPRPPRPFAAVHQARDLVITLCDRARRDLGSLSDVHWSLPNPSERRSRAAYRATLRELDDRICTLLDALADR